MPRRYRPPTRRRKGKRVPLEEAAAAAEGMAVAAEPPARPAPAAVPIERGPARPEKHISRDYSYVLGEVRLIAILVAFIVGGLVITAVFR